MKNYLILNALDKTKRYLILIPIFSILFTFFTTQIPMYIKYAIDGLFYQDMTQIPSYITKFFVPHNFVYNLVILMIFLLATNILIALISYVRNQMSSSFTLQVDRNLKSTIFKHIQKLEYQNYSSYDKAEMLQRIKEDASSYSNFFNSQFTLLLDTFFFVFFILYQTIQINRFIGIYILINVMALILFGIWYFKKLDTTIGRKIRARKQLLERTVETVNHIKLTRMFQKQNEEIEEYQTLNNEYTNTNIKLLNLILFHEIITDHISYLSTPIIFIIGGILMIQGQLTIGSLTVLVSFAEKIMRYFISLGNNLDTIDDFIQIHGLLKQFMKLEEEKKIDSPMSIQGDIIFLNVGIKIEGHEILRNINFQIREGEKVAIVGDNGVGKSILVKTLLGFYEYTGNIYINQTNLKRISKKTIREQIGLILEDTFIFQGTVKENITLQQDIEQDKLTSVCKKAQIEEEIEKFSQRYQTPVGEKGITLSGGQQQRMAIARMLLLDKPILVIDDGMSKLDEITKTKVLEEAILQQKSTTILVTQDWSFLEKMDHVIFINNGTTYFGTHAELQQKEDYQNRIRIKQDII